MKNIGIFTHDLYPYKPWGQGRYVYDLVNHLRKICSHNIFLFSPSKGIRDPMHIQIFPGSHSTIGKNITFSIKSAYIVEGLIKRHNLGIVHFQGGPGGLFLIKKLSVPLIYTVHHTYYQQSTYIKSQRWKRLLYLWEKYSYHKASYLMCDSISTYNIIRRHYSIGKDLCKTVPVGVDQYRFFNTGSTRIPNSLFFLGRLDSRKGIDFLIKAIPYVKRRLQNVKLFIGGEGILKSRLETFVKNNQLENNVRFLGTIEDEKLNEWYNKVEVVVIPSIFEGFGLTAIEAMACGTPVIATDADALRDIVNNGINGLLVHYNDVKGLQNSILDVLTNKNKWSLLSNNGKKIIKTDYNWPDIANQVLKIYKHASEHNKGP